MEQHHGRLETREIWATGVEPERLGFYGAQQVARLHRHFQTRSTGKASDETVLAVTGLCALPQPEANAERLLDIARGHWSIENGNHYRRDRSYDEDRCQVRDPNSAQILSTLRSLAAFLTRQGAHRPRSAHQKTTPALHRFCNAYRSQPIHWLISARGFRC